MASLLQKSPAFAGLGLTYLGHTKFVLYAPHHELLNFLNPIRNSWVSRFRGWLCSGFFLICSSVRLGKCTTHLSLPQGHDRAPKPPIVQ